MEEILQEIRSNHKLQLSQSLALFESLKDTADSEIQGYILGIVKKHIGRPEVFHAWCKALGESWAKPLRYELILSLNEAIRRDLLFQAWHEPLAEQLTGLLPLLKEESLRDEALILIQQVVIAAPNARALLKVLALSRKKSEKELMLKHLFSLRHHWGPAADFFAELLKKDGQSIHENWRSQVVSFLLEKDKLSMADQIRLLKEGEGEELRFEILRHWNQRFVKRNAKAAALAVQLIKTEPSARVRTMAANLLVKCLPTDPSLLNVLVEVFKSAAEPLWQEQLHSYLSDLLGDPKYSALLLAELQDGIIHSASLELSQRCTALLEPLLSEPGEAGEAVFRCLCEALQQQQQQQSTASYRHILKSLSVVAAMKPGLSQLLADGFSGISNDLIRAELIIILAELPELPRQVAATLAREAVAALHATETALRAAGLYYLLCLRLSPDAQELMASGIHLLNDSGISADIRTQYAHKLSRLTHMSPEALQELEKALKAMKDGGHRHNTKPLLLKLAERMRNAAGLEQEPDWHDFLERIQNNKALDGITPAVYLHYEKNPAKALLVLKAMLQQPAFSYQLLAEQEDVLNFLLAHNQIDAEIAHLAFDRLILHEIQDSRLNYYLMLLKNYPGLHREVPRLWLVFERKNNQRYLNPTLLRELLIKAMENQGNQRQNHDHQEKLCRQMIAQLREKTTTQALEPYLLFLKNNPGWAYSKEVLAFFEEILEDRPQLSEDGIRDKVNSLRLELGLDKLRPGLKIEKHKKGGLLDD